MAETLAPFTCTYSPNMPELLYSLGCSIAISTYQAGKVIFISAPEPKRLVQLPRNFDKPMGLALRDNHLAVATRDQVVVLGNARKMAPNFPAQPNTYDALFLPRAVYFTGETDIHDLMWIRDELWGVNTRFSCLSVIDPEFSFKPFWKPWFIDTLTPQDQCHLNGVAIVNEAPHYASALGMSHLPEGWRSDKLTGGILIDVPKNKLLAKGLGMPHSPRVYDDRLFVLLSATGELAEIDRDSGKAVVRKNFNGFVRGMDRIGEFLFIGLSRLRETSSAFRDLPIADKSLFAGVAVVHLPTFAVAGYIKYETSVEEIYDVKILQGVRRAGIVSPEKEERKIAITTPDGDYWAVEKSKS